MEHTEPQPLSVLEHHLPEELIKEVLVRCGIQALGRISQSNKTFNKFSNDNWIWAQLHPDPKNTKGHVPVSSKQHQDATRQEGYMKYHLKCFLSAENPRMCPCCVKSKNPNSWIFQGAFCSSCYNSFGLGLRIDTVDAKTTYLLDDVDINLLTEKRTKVKGAKGSPADRPKFFYEFHVRRVAILKYGSLNHLQQHMAARGIYLNADKEVSAQRKIKRKREEQEQDLLEAERLAAEPSIRRSGRLAKRPRLHYHEPTPEEIEMEMEEWLPSRTFQI